MPWYALPSLVYLGAAGVLLWAGLWILAVPRLLAVVLCWLRWAVNRQPDPPPFLVGYAAVLWKAQRPRYGIDRADRDRPLLREIAHRINAEGHGVDPRTMGAAIGMGHDAVDQAADPPLQSRAVARPARRRPSGDGSRTHHRRAEEMAQALLTALDDAATNIPDDEERSKLQAVGSVLTGLTVNTLGGVAAYVLIKLMGWG